MEGRVKTLNPMIHGGFLAKHDDPSHQAQMEEHGISRFEVVCVNLYPFHETISKPDVTLKMQSKTSISVDQQCYVLLRKTMHT